MATLCVATWNLNNRAGKRKFLAGTADAAIALGADIIVFTEFFPQEAEDRFKAALAHAGLNNQLFTQSSIANRVLIASRLPLQPLPLELPTFDEQFPPNILGVRLPSIGLSIVGARIPWYSGDTAHLRTSAWEWLKTTADSLKHGPAMITGDFNVQASTRLFRKTFAEPWHRAAHGKTTFFGYGGKNSEIDHIIATDHCILSEVRVEKTLLSDHAALVCRVKLPDSFKPQSQC
jgi:endonuclease/exonuclease/phosphatase (EEP) superfamily protein YafD